MSATLQTNPFHAAIEKHARAPIAFVRDILGAEPDPWQLEALRAVARGHTRLAIRSGHGVGKTCFAAWLCVWFICTRAPFKVAITAPSSSQLFDALWPEFIKWLSILPSGWRDLWDIRSDRVTLKADQECFVTARTSRPDTPEAMAGLHSAHVLLIADEASGIPESVFEAASGSMSSHGAITLLIGNATRSTGFFYRAHMMERDRWYTQKVSSASSSRVTSDFVNEVANRYGMDSNAFRVRVLGEFPLADDNTLIGADLVDSAMLRDIEIDMTTPEYWGCDVARFGTDSSVLIKRRGNVVTEMPRAWHQFDTMMLAGAIKAEYDLQTVKPTLICVDVIGIGAGVVDRLNEMDVPVLGVNVAETSSTTGQYARLRDELWVRCKEWLGGRNVRLPRHDRLRDDLLMPRYSFLSDGRLLVESKQSMRSRGLPSCDYADALCMTFVQHGMGVGSGMTSGLHSSTPIHMSLAQGDLV
jgi:hypothetical protein